MKTHLGFVSNSSSSSFLLITTEENHQKALEQLPKFFADAFDKMVERIEFDGKKLVKIEEQTGERFEDCGYDWKSIKIPKTGLPEDFFPEKDKKGKYDKWEVRDYLYETFNEYQELVQKDKKKCIVQSLSF